MSLGLNSLPGICVKVSLERTFCLSSNSSKNRTKQFDHSTLQIFTGVYRVINNMFLRERGMASNPKMEYQVFLCIFQKNSAMATLQIYTAENGTHVKNVKVTSICRRYRVSHSKVSKVILLRWGCRFLFLLIFWILHVHEIGAFMPNSSVFYLFDVARPLLDDK